MVTPCRYNAGTCLIVAFDKNNVYTYPGSQRESGVEDATIVATHLMLAAANEEVDSCWLNCIDLAKAKELFGLPENEKAVLLLPLGYPAPDAAPSPNHEKCKPLEATVKFL